MSRRFPLLTIVVLSALAGLASVLLASRETASAQTVATDRAALVAFYNATNGDNWTSNTNWLSDKPLNEWHGVGTRSDGRVRYVILEGYNLTGSIPPEIGNLTALTDLRLSGNSLSGSIPPELGNLTGLDFLWLSENSLSGSIPPELGNLTNASWLMLDDNQLTGSIPPELGNMSGLDWLRLDDNQLTGTIPRELGNLSNSEFKILGLSENSLSGSIPPELGNLHNLWGLYLYSNRLTGVLPQSLTSLTKLDEFEFYNSTGLCAPRNSAFQNWLRGVRSVNGPNCAPPRPTITPTPEPTLIPIDELFDRYDVD
ncbi:MAG: hypothetical protein F4X34_06525, partial [Chloroflexi bacterium]|nr:hypothetical protein [Chloroflexota bacterium]